MKIFCFQKFILEFLGGFVIVEVFFFIIFAKTSLVKYKCIDMKSEFLSQSVSKNKTFINLTRLQYQVEHLEGKKIRWNIFSTFSSFYKNMDSFVFLCICAALCFNT